MREIKFRGKATMSVKELDEIYFEHDNGWVVGNLIQNGNKPWIVVDVVESDPEYIVHNFWVRVHPESVGQYTDLKDKNSKNIYEGDISRDEWNDCYGIVKFDEGKFVYEWENICEDLSEVHDYLDVIGNIYENPEMLEGESNV